MTERFVKVSYNSLEREEEGNPRTVEERVLFRVRVVDGSIWITCSTHLSMLRVSRTNETKGKRKQEEIEERLTPEEKTEYGNHGNVHDCRT